VAALVYASEIRGRSLLEADTFWSSAYSRSGPFLFVDPLLADGADERDQEDEKPSGDDADGHPHDVALFYFLPRFLSISSGNGRSRRIFAQNLAEELRDLERLAVPLKPKSHLFDLSANHLREPVLPLAHQRAALRVLEFSRSSI
jgi:hypothetical protein